MKIILMYGHILKIKYLRISRVKTQNQLCIVLFQLFFTVCFLKHKKLRYSIYYIIAYFHIMHVHLNKNSMLIMIRCVIRIIC